MAALSDAAVLTHDTAQSREFAGKLLVQFDDLVECVGDLGIQPVIDILDPDGEISVPKSLQGAENLTTIELFLGRNKRAHNPSPAGHWKLGSIADPRLTRTQ
jgi:hypothetical protein